MEMHDNSEKMQRALLVGIDTGEYDAESSIKELHELVESAGAEPVASLMQKRDKPDGATCVGSGTHAYSDKKYRGLHGRENHRQNHAHIGYLCDKGKNQ